MQKMGGLCSEKKKMETRRDNGILLLRRVRVRRMNAAKGWVNKRQY